MSEKDFHKKLIEHSNSTNRADNTKKEATPLVFHRVRSCPSCEESVLSSCDFGVFPRSDFFGMTSDGHQGCGRVELAGIGERAIFCQECGYELHMDFCTHEELMELVVAEGQDIQVPNVSCPVCQSTFLCEHETEVELVREVRAVYTIPGDNDAEEQAEIAFAPHPDVHYAGALRYPVFERSRTDQGRRESS
jgi:hypothetical protein